jgi:hypothetical protein
MKLVPWRKAPNEPNPFNIPITLPAYSSLTESLLNTVVIVSHEKLKNPTKKRLIKEYTSPFLIWLTT